MLEVRRPRSAHRQRGDAHSSAKCEPQPPRYIICRRYLVIGACLGRGLNSTSRAVWSRGSERRQSALSCRASDAGGMVGVAPQPPFAEFHTASASSVSGGWESYNRALTAVEHPADGQADRPKCACARPHVYSEQLPGFHWESLCRCGRTDCLPGGLWERWRNRAAGDVLQSFTIVTPVPNEL